MRVTHVRHILVLPDREAADDLAEELAGRLPLPEYPRPVREALAGEDDAEDAQWLVVLEDPEGRFDTIRLDELAAARDGWLERD